MNAHVYGKLADLDAQHKLAVEKVARLSVRWEKAVPRGPSVWRHFISRLGEDPRWKKDGDLDQATRSRLREPCRIVGGPIALP